MHAICRIIAKIQQNSSTGNVDLDHKLDNRSRHGYRWTHSYDHMRIRLFNLFSAIFRL